REPRCANGVPAAERYRPSRAPLRGALLASLLRGRVDREGRGGRTVSDTGRSSACARRAASPPRARGPLRSRRRRGRHESSWWCSRVPPQEVLERLTNLLLLIPDRRFVQAELAPDFALAELPHEPELEHLRPLRRQALGPKSRDQALRVEVRLHVD